MIFTATELGGVYIVELEKREDSRGFFARTFCQQEFEDHGLNARLVQCSVSLSHQKGTLRGMHYQVAPHTEAKLVRCTRGQILDVAIDMRSDSPTFKKHVCVLLTAENRTALYIPEYCAHGFQTLQDESEVFYQMSEFYAPECGRGVRWNDPAFAIEWPIQDPIMLERDRAYPDFVK